MGDLDGDGREDLISSGTELAVRRGASGGLGAPEPQALSGPPGTTLSAATRYLSGTSNY